MTFMVPPAMLSQPSPLITSSRNRNLPKHPPEKPRIRRKISLPRLPSRMLSLGNLGLGETVENDDCSDDGSDERGLLGNVGDGREESEADKMKKGFQYTVVEVDGEGEDGGGQERDDRRLVHTLGHLPDRKKDTGGARIVRSVRFAGDFTPSTGLDGHVTPDTHSANASDETLTPSNYNEKSADPIGKWRCCKCKKGHDIYSFTQGSHPVSVLNCVCTHRSCWACTLDGLIKSFEPMNDPEVVQLSEDGSKQVRFGVFCDGCGLSWRAQEIGNGLATKSALQRISAIPKLLVRRGGHPLQKLRHSQSMSNLSSVTSTCPRLFHPSFGASRSALNLRALSNEMAKGHGKQAEFTTVKFIGIQCTCGLTTDVTSLCFQVVDPPMDLLEAKEAELSDECYGPVFTSTPVDQARGHGTPLITLKSREHPNPLMSNPLKGDFGGQAQAESDLRTLVEGSDSDFA